MFIGEENVVFTITPVNGVTTLFGADGEIIDMRVMFKAYCHYLMIPTFASTIKVGVDDQLINIDPEFYPTPSIIAVKVKYPDTQVVVDPGENKDVVDIFIGLHSNAVPVPFEPVPAYEVSIE